MSAHPSPSASTSQCDCILQTLERNAGQWVTLGLLHVVSGSMAVHSRISDLRKRGHRIEHKNEHPTGKRAVHSFYRLLTPNN